MDNLIKYIDVYINTQGDIVSTNFPDESIKQYSNNFIVRALVSTLDIDTIAINILPT